MVCWGITNLSSNTALVPIKISSLIAGTIRSLVLRSKQFCVLKTDGSVACGGATPTQILGLTKGTTAAIAVGHRHACALQTNGSVVCWETMWGDDSNNRKAPVQVSDLGPGTTVAISAGDGGHTCALKTSGSVVLLGSSPLGQLDNNDPGIAPWISHALKPIPVYGLNRESDVF